MTLSLGFAVPSGAAVAIPLKHTAITGMTQEAGKTTTLEALIARSGLRAVTFVTKRGEGSFTNARRIAPYFRERADWQFVASILEASRGEKLKFERAWIIRASKGALTLEDVHRNVRRAMESAKGLAADVYLTLDAYLDVVVPQIARVAWAPRLDLSAGVNAVDLTGVPLEMQHLVIQSSIDWVLEREQDTVVVVPEAWKFLPQGRGTPVKRSAEALIRQGAALHNFLWLDSQDLGGIEKTILRSVAVWVLGVQREANEIARTLANIPDGIAKPKKADLATLELGQFYACWGRHAVKTYVQPAWMSPETAQHVAMGHPVAVQAHRGDLRPPALPTIPKEETVTTTEATRLTDENAALRQENADLRRRLEALELRSAPASTPGRPTAPPAPVTATAPAPGVSVKVLDNDALYESFKARLLAEAPAVLQLAVSRPEIEVRLERRTLPIEPMTLKGRIARLLKDGFFAEPRGCGAVRGALKRTGPDANTANIGRALDDFRDWGFVTDEGSAGYREVPGMKVHVIEA